jgi:hypothetical protein
MVRFSVSHRRFLTTNLLKYRIRHFPPICRSCASLSVAYRRNMLALSVGRCVSARHYKRGTTFTRGGTVRHKSSEARKPGWLLLVINAVSPVPNQSPSLFHISCSQAGLGGSCSRRTVGGRAVETWPSYGRDDARG